MALLSLRAYARQRGVTLAAVQKALRSGRISIQPSGQIDSERADAEWLRNTAPRIHGCNGYTLALLAYGRARAVREHCMAELARLKYEERAANLVSKIEVQIVASKMFQDFRDHMLRIPSKIAAILAAETDPAKCYDLLDAEVREALNEFCDSIT